MFFSQTIKLIIGQLGRKDYTGLVIFGPFDLSAKRTRPSNLQLEHSTVSQPWITAINPAPARRKVGQDGICTSAGAEDVPAR